MDKPNDLDISTTKSKALKNEEPYDTRDLVNDIAGFRDIIIRNEDS